ncbi:MAG: hypothetical protein CL930_06735 [Deltaproteobacteria bacterium]|nr:hypothetical protein [Deltaproteobacteria bacterium]|tara:strand:- start:10 stop:399 length:390 start_codon:yes stop_codon:yes gene_type:complete
MSQSRNAACACGSGLKYKRCCGAPGAEPKVAVDSADDGMVESTTKKKPTWALPLGLEVLAIAAAVVVGVLRESAADGLAVGMALSMAVVVFVFSRGAPQSTGRGSSTAINFGMGGRRAARRKNRKNRRR